MSTRRDIRKRLNRVMRDLEEVEREVVVFMDGGAPDLVGVAEAAEILKTSPNAISLRRRRGTFPEPIVTLACGPIWHREDVERLDPTLL